MVDRLICAHIQAIDLDEETRALLDALAEENLWRLTYDDETIHSEADAYVISLETEKSKRLNQCARLTLQGKPTLFLVPQDQADKVIAAATTAGAFDLITFPVSPKRLEFFVRELIDLSYLRNQTALLSEENKPAYKRPIPDKPKRVLIINPSEGDLARVESAVGTDCEVFTEPCDDTDFDIVIAPFEEQIASNLSQVDCPILGFSQNQNDLATMGHEITFRHLIPRPIFVSYLQQRIMLSLQSQFWQKESFKQFTKASGQQLDSAAVSQAAERACKLAIETGRLLTIIRLQLDTTFDPVENKEILNQIFDLLQNHAPSHTIVGYTEDDDFCLLLHGMDETTSIQQMNRLAGLIGFSNYTITGRFRPVQVQVEGYCLTLQPGDTWQSLKDPLRKMIAPRKKMD